MNLQETINKLIPFAKEVEWRKIISLPQGEQILPKLIKIKNSISMIDPNNPDGNVQIKTSRIKWLYVDHDSSYPLGWDPESTSIEDLKSSLLNSLIFNQTDFVYTRTALQDGNGFYKLIWSRLTNEWM